MLFPPDLNEWAGLLFSRRLLQVFYVIGALQKYPVLQLVHL